MQSKIFGPFFAIIWGGICYQGGRISQQQLKDDYSFNKVQIQRPKIEKISQAIQSEQNPTQSNFNITKNMDTFTVQLIQTPIKRINYPNFKILYSQYHKCPLAVHQKVTKSLADGDAPRRTSFFVEESLPLNFRATNDHFIKSQAYKNFYFARGHMAAAGNYSGNKQAKFQTFTYANVIPQNQHNNAGIWNTFERYSRNLILDDKCDSLQVISGPIYYKNNTYKNQNGDLIQKVYKQQSIVLLQNGIVVPQKLYKILKCNKKQGYYIDAFQFWNKKTYDNQKSLESFTTSVKSIQNQTGLKFHFQNQNVNSSNKLGNFIDLDHQGMTKNKKYYDEGFYNALIKKATTIQQMNNAFHRAKQQKIFINLQSYTEQTKNLFHKQINKINNDIKQNNYLTSCKNLSNLMKLNKNLFYLHQLTQQYSQKIKQSQNNGPINKCLQKANILRGKKWQDFNENQKNTPLSKQQKVKVNSITHAITSSLKKQQQTAKHMGSIEEAKKVTVSYVNQEQLKKFVIAVNLEETLANKVQ